MYKDFGMKLELLLGRDNMPRKNLADRIGVTVSYISQLLTGVQNNPSLAVAAAIAQVFGVSLEWLAGVPEPEVNTDQLPPDEQELIRLYRATDNKLRGAAIVLVKSLADVSAKEVSEEKERSRKS